MLRCLRRLTVAAAAVAMTAATMVTNGAGAATSAPIPPAAFGMHLLGAGVHSYPRLGFGSARIWDMGVTWADLQPTATTLLDDSNPAVQRLDAIVHLFAVRGVRPLIVLGMTPKWAIDSACHAPAPWPAETCGPTVIAGQSPAWSSYVLFLAQRYSDVDFEVWNEPNLRNGWNDTLSKLATLQQLADQAVHAVGSGDTVVSPGIAITAGSPLTWLHDFLQEPGGRAFDEVGIHLYPIDLAARRGYGPEWSMQVLAQARRVLTAGGVSAPIWDTEVNVGRYVFRKSSSRVFTGTSGAAMVARTYLLQLSGGVSRVYWYAADDLGWGGTWLEQPDLRHLSPAGSAYAVLRGLLVGARATGCHSSHGRYSCSFRLTHGRTLTAMWTTGASYRTRPPAGSHVTRTVTGAPRSVSSRTRVVVGSTPVYFLNHR